MGAYPKPETGGVARRSRSPSSQAPATGHLLRLRRLGHYPSTWHLPYLDAQGEIDHSRLPKAIQAVLTNYRGAHVSSIPEEAVPLVLQRLATAARRSGRMPPECLEPAAVYVQLAQALL
jgi:hypothetical protein